MERTLQKKFSAVNTKKINPRTAIARLGFKQSVTNEKQNGQIKSHFNMECRIMT